MTNKQYMWEMQPYSAPRYLASSTKDSLSAPVNWLTESTQFLRGKHPSITGTGVNKGLEDNWRTHSFSTHMAWKGQQKFHTYLFQEPYFSNGNAWEILSNYLNKYSSIMFLPARCQWRLRPLWPPLSSPTAAPLHSLQLCGSGLWALCLRFLSPGEIAEPQPQHQSQQEENAFQKRALPRCPLARLSLVLVPLTGYVQSQPGELCCRCPLVAEPCQLQAKNVNGKSCGI